MYAIFLSGGKQYRVSEGSIVHLEKLNTSIGDLIEFNTVMMISNDHNIQIGHPFIENGSVIAQVLKHHRDKKIKIIKFNRRKHFRKHQGHRQWLTDVKITEIKI